MQTCCRVLVLASDQMLDVASHHVPLRDHRMNFHCFLRTVLVNFVLAKVYIEQVLDLGVVYFLRLVCNCVIVLLGNDRVLNQGSSSFFQAEPSVGSDCQRHLCSVRLSCGDGLWAFHPIVPQVGSHLQSLKLDDVGHESFFAVRQLKSKDKMSPDTYGAHLWPPFKHFLKRGLTGSHLLKFHLALVCVELHADIAIELSAASGVVKSALEVKR